MKKIIIFIVIAECLGYAKGMSRKGEQLPEGAIPPEDLDRLVNQGLIERREIPDPTVEQEEEKPEPEAPKTPEVEKPEPTDYFGRLALGLVPSEDDLSQEEAARVLRIQAGEETLVLDEAALIHKTNAELSNMVEALGAEKPKSGIKKADLLTALAVAVEGYIAKEELDVEPKTDEETKVDETEGEKAPE